MMGRTRNNKIVVFDGSERHRGQLLDLKITRAEAHARLFWWYNSLSRIAYGAPRVQLPRQLSHKGGKT